MQRPEHRIERRRITAAGERLLTDADGVRNAARAGGCQWLRGWRRRSGRRAETAVTACLAQLPSMTASRGDETKKRAADPDDPPPQSCQLTLRLATLWRRRRRRRRRRRGRAGLGRQDHRSIRARLRCRRRRGRRRRRRRLDRSRSRLRRQEVDRRANPEQAAERIPGTRVGVAVARTSRAEVGATDVGVATRDPRRIVVEQVVDTCPQVDPIQQREGAARSK